MEKMMIKVNGKMISEKEFDMACAEKMHALRKNRLEKNEIEETANLLIDALLMLEVADKENIEVDSAEIEETVSKIKNNFKTEEDFNNALEKTGDTLDSIRERIEKNFKLRNFVQKKFFEKTEVSDEDAKKYYEQYPDKFTRNEEVRASHILFNEAEKDKALEAHERLLKGEDFAECAKEHSICPSGKEGGDLGFFDKGKMVPEFEEAAFSTGKGEISNLVTSQFGHHIIKITDKKPAGKYEFDEIKDSLKQSIAGAIVNEKIQKYNKELRETAEIVIDKDILTSKFQS
ncbi:MAG: peptidylprolyl isomerase [Candidatus Delongbacteria bacterium]